VLLSNSIPSSQIVSTTGFQPRNKTFDFICAESNRDQHLCNLLLNKIKNIYKLKISHCIGVPEYPILQVVWIFRKRERESAIKVADLIESKLEEIQENHNQGMEHPANLAPIIREAIQSIAVNHRIGMIKSASQTPEGIFSGCTFGDNTTINVSPGGGSDSVYHSDDDPNNVYSSIIRNNDRYGSDTHRVWIIRTANKDGLSLVLEVRAERDGILSYSDYWHYNPSETGTRDISFNELIKISNNIKDKIENQHLPVAMIATLFKSATRYLDLPYKEKSTVSNFNESTLVDAEMDWRSSLYGNRYPQQDHPGSIRDNWSSTEQHKEKSQSIQEDGNSLRHRVVKYQYE